MNFLPEKRNNHDHCTIFMAFIWVHTLRRNTHLKVVLFNREGQPALPKEASHSCLEPCAETHHDLKGLHVYKTHAAYLAQLVLFAKASSGCNVPGSLHCLMCDRCHPCHHRLSNICHLLFGLLSHWDKPRTMADEETMKR